MRRETNTKQKDRPEMTELRTRLEEAEETLRALRSGEVDAVVVGEQIYLLESAEAASNRLRGDALALVHDAVIVVDNDNRVTYLNLAAKQLYGLAATEALGRALDEVYQSLWLRPEDEAAHATLSTTGSWRGENIHIKRNGERLYVESSVSLLRNYTGTPTGLLAIIRDVTERHRAEAALRQSEERFALATQAVGAVIYDWQIVPDRIERSPELVNLLGFAPDEPGVATNAWYHTRLHPDDDVRARQVITNAIANRAPRFEDEHRLQHKDGHYVWVRDSGVLLYDEHGTAVRSVGSIRNIDQRKQVEESLRESEDRFRNMADHAPVMIWVTEPDGYCTYLSQSWYEFTGQTAETGLGFGWLDATHPDDKSYAEKVFLVANETRDDFRLEYRLRRKDGSYAWAIDSAQPRFDANGKYLGYIGSVIDITERKRAEESLKHQTTLLEALTESVLDGILIVSVDGRMLYSNQRFLDIWNFPPEVVAAQSDQSALEWAAQQTVNPAAFLARVKAVYDQPDGEVREEITLKDGRVFDRFGAPIRSGAVQYGWVWTFRDITERKRAEAKLIESENRLRRAVAELPFPTIIHHEDDSILEVSRGWTNYSGYTKEDIPTITAWTKRAYGEKQALVKEYIDHLFEVNETIPNGEWIINAKDGSQRVWDFFTTPLGKAAGEGRLLLSIAADVTERKLTEQALQASEEQYRTLFDSIDEGYCIIEMIFDANEKPIDYRFLQVNPSFERQTGLQDAIGKTILDFAPEMEQHWFETYGHIALTGDAARFENRAEQLHRWYDVYAYRFGAPEKRQVAVLFNDITERKEAQVERERLLAQEQQARATAEAATRAKDEFLAVVSHELRNPLNAILGYTRMARAQAHNAAAVIRHCEIVERSAKMQQQLIEDLLDTARIISGKLKIEVAPTDLRLVLEEALSVVLPAATAKQINLIARLGDEPQLVIGDAARLQQIAWNLLQNAIKFTPSGGRVELRLERADDQTLIIVSDTGQGIEQEFLQAVFDRFSQRDMARTRRHGGLGLGLALVKDLVALHGGTATVISAGRGLGATFTITLPSRAPQLIVDPSPLCAIAEVRTGPEAMSLDGLPRLDNVRVLVVDDQEEAREIVAVTLTEWGAKVTTAASGAEARVWLTEQPYDVLVCDISMPDEDGYAVIGKIRALEQERRIPFTQRLPAVALTALTRPEDRWQALSAGFQMHVAKPVELAELVISIYSLTQNRSQVQG